MKIYISYSHKDRDAVERITSRLTQDGHDIWIDSQSLAPGDVIEEKFVEGLAQSDVLIVVVSENSFRSKWVQREFSMLALNQISSRDKRIIPIKIDESEVPSYLADRYYLDLSLNFQAGLEKLSETLRSPILESFTRPATTATSTETRADQIAKLRDALRQGNLTLMCGAGVSVEAGIPAWGNLLVRLLELMMDKLSRSHPQKLGELEAAEFQKRHGASSLILGKFLKNNLGDEFPIKVREALYEAPLLKSPLIESIIQLARPQRHTRSLESIITFNFDSIIEENFDSNQISNRAIYSESIKHKGHEIPIYHVHGYLPRQGELPEKSTLVFSEDAYHTQFIDPFSWSNLIQLTKLTQNTCLLIGISLTDPNMRRLLDVVWRKNPEKTLGHYIIKRKPTSFNGGALDDISKLLEEQDANALGLNVIWIDEYQELPGILTQIAHIR